MNFQERKPLWINLAHSLKMIDITLVRYVQGLGKLDGKLAIDEERFKKYFTENPDVQKVDNVQEWAEMRTNKSDQIILSQLWVLGCYEAIRTIDQFLRETKVDNFLNSSEMFKNAKHFYERVRIPLAKLEPSKVSKGKDNNIAIPGYSESASMIWKINNEEYIAREDLANVFIESLKTLAEEF
jgi:hypothetical protein